MGKKAFRIKTSEGEVLAIARDEFDAHDAVRDYLRERNLIGTAAILSTEEIADEVTRGRTPKLIIK